MAYIIGGYGRGAVNVLLNFPGGGGILAVLFSVGSKNFFAQNWGSELFYVDVDVVGSYCRAVVLHVIYWYMFVFGVVCTG
jgi:hypothetical protein